MLQQRGTAAANPSTLLYSFCVCALLLLCVFLSLSFLLFPQRPNYHSAEDFLLARRETHTRTQHSGSCSHRQRSSSSTCVRSCVCVCVLASPVTVIITDLERASPLALDSPTEPTEVVVKRFQFPGFSAVYLRLLHRPVGQSVERLNILSACGTRTDGPVENQVGIWFIPFVFFFWGGSYCHAPTRAPVSQEMQGVRFTPCCVM